MKGETIVLQIKGMHCSSCALNIDGTLEETDGVLASNTNYARSQTKIDYDPNLVTITHLQSLISQLGYQTQLL